ncbi:MAG: hypothetical protein M3R32_04860 [Chloroflexota bacterium]|nr:hypothetical protein [Chloroflexota bacterium]
MALSVAGMGLVIAHVAVAGTGPEADEGTLARVWWLLMLAQLPLVASFAITQLPRSPRPALIVLALQGSAVIANLAAVRWFNL